MRNDENFCNIFFVVILNLAGSVCYLPSVCRGARTPVGARGATAVSAALATLSPTAAARMCKCYPVVFTAASANRPFTTFPTQPLKAPQKLVADNRTSCVRTALYNELFQS